MQRISFTCLLVTILIGVSISCFKREQSRDIRSNNVVNDSITLLGNGQEESDGVSNSDVLIEFGQERGECSDCSVYDASISRDGRVVYNGMQNVRVVGSKEFTIPKPLANKLEQEFLKQKFFDLSDRYVEGELCPERWTDGPTYRLAFRSKGTTKTVYHYSGCRGTQELRRLASLEATVIKLLAIRDLTGENR